MNISRGQWLVAVLGAAAIHLCLLGLLLLGNLAPRPPDESPRGVMVSLDAFDPGPPPQSAVEPAPVEAPEAQPATAAAPESNDASSASGVAAAVTPESSVDIGPQPADVVASSDAAAPSPVAAVSPSNAPVASAVTIHPDDISEPIKPQEQVTARSARPGDLAPAEANNKPSNGAFGSSEQATDDYIVRVRGWLSRHKQYPASARKDEIAGTVRLYLVVDASGNVITERVIQSSGSQILDDAALQMLSRAQPLPRMPASMHRNRLELVVPVVFSLR